MTSLTPFRTPIDDLFDGFFVRPVNMDRRRTERANHFSIDVFEAENAYRVLADLPGVRKEDINVTIEGPEVAISAEVKREENGNQREEALVTERFAGKYYRSFTLGHEIDRDNAQARYVDGVLELTLPKSADAMPKRITIQ